jgi:hypothetical protein
MTRFTVSYYQLYDIKTLGFIRLSAKALKEIIERLFQPSTFCN